MLAEVQAEIHLGDATLTGIRVFDLPFVPVVGMIFEIRPGRDQIGDDFTIEYVSYDVNSGIFDVLLAAVPYDGPESDIVEMFGPGWKWSG